jgi:hypothetical protein
VVWLIMDDIKFVKLKQDISRVRRTSEISSTISLIISSTTIIPLVIIIADNKKPDNLSPIWPKTPQHVKRGLIHFLFDTVRIWEFSPVWTDFDKFDNLSKRNVKLILKIFSDLEPLRGSSNKKTLYSTRSCVILAFFGTRGPLKLSFHSSFKLVRSCPKKPKLHTNSLNK